MNLAGNQMKMTAKKTKGLLERIRQGDIFQDISVIENIELNGSRLLKDEIVFPYVVCLNQECDLVNDFDTKERGKDSSLLHLAIAPAFIFEHFLSGSHWGKIFINGSTGKRSDTKIKAIIDNEIPRYHYLNFAEADMPELIIDFKHFFSVNRNMLYQQIGKRLCSVDDLFREKINQRFSFYISRIGLPV